MRTVWMLLLTLTISTLFIHVPNVGQIGFLGHPMMVSENGDLVELKLTYNQYVWMFSEHLILVILALIIWDQSKKYRRIVRGYLLITIADTVLWVLYYYDPLGNYILTWNILKTVLFVGAIVYEQQLFRNKSNRARARD